MNILRDGFTQVPVEVLDDNTVSVPARFLYSVLLSFAWENNQVYPGQNRLAEALGVSDKSVRTYLSELEKKGYLTKKRRGLNHTNIYTLNKWIPPGYKRKKVPLKKQKKSPLKKGSQFPSNNTQVKKTHIDQTQSEGVSTLLTQNEKSDVSLFKIIEVCEPHIKRVSKITLVDEGVVYDVLKKMASHYSAKATPVKDYRSMLVRWVMQDLENGKISKSSEVISEVRNEKLRERLWSTVAEVFGEDWRQTDGLVNNVKEFLLAQKGLETPLAELKIYLKNLKEANRVGDN